MSETLHLYRLLVGNVACWIFQKSHACSILSACVSESLQILQDVCRCVLSISNWYYFTLQYRVNCWYGNSSELFSEGLFVAGKDVPCATKKSHCVSLGSSRIDHGFLFSLCLMGFPKKRWSYYQPMQLAGFFKTLTYTHIQRETSPPPPLPRRKRAPACRPKIMVWVGRLHTWFVGFGWYLGSFPSSQIQTFKNKSHGKDDNQVDGRQKRLFTPVAPVTYGTLKKTKRNSHCWIQWLPGFTICELNVCSAFILPSIFFGWKQKWRSSRALGWNLPMEGSSRGAVLLAWRCWELVEIEGWSGWFISLGHSFIFRGVPVCHSPQVRIRFA